MNKNENINDLISKFLSGNAMPDDAILLEEWKNELPENQIYFSECEKVFNALANSVASKQINTTAAWNKVNQAIQPKLSNNKLKYWRVAASLTLLIGIGALVSYFLNTSPSQEFICATTNQKQFIKLADSTEISVFYSKIFINS